MKKLIVIGASSGLGFQVASDFARLGWRVGIAARREEPLKALKEQYPDRIEYLAFDVAADDAPDRFAELIELIDGMDYLLYAAGCGWLNPSLDNAQDTRTLMTNVVGFTRIMNAAYKYYKATANDINWLEKVKMQGAIQKWVDHSISVTINLPNDVSEDLINDLYLEAWKVGCKGCTVYRDGSRSGVLVATQKEKKKEQPAEPTLGIFAERHVLNRPIELDADVVRFQNNKEKWIAFVGLLNGKPYEIFTGLADDDDGIFCPKSVNKGKIIKAIDENGNKRYDFQFINKRGYKTTIEGLSDKFNPEYWNYAKLISGVLRYGMPIDQVMKLVGGLELNSQSINTWKMGVERALKKYLPDGTTAKGQKCPNCGQETLIYQEGCLICTSCGTSRCG